MCHRHHGIGADGLILYSLRDRGATMKLLNADGSCVGAVWQRAALSGGARRAQPGSVDRIRLVTVDTDAGVKRLELLARDGERYTFRAAMGQPTNLRQATIDVAGESVTASVLRIGNPAVRRARPAARCRTIQPPRTGARHACDVSGWHQRRVRRTSKRRIACGF